MPRRIQVSAPIQLLVEGADAKYFFIHFLNQMGFNKVDADVQSDEEWRGQSRVYRDAPDLIASLGLTDSLEEHELEVFNRVRSAILNRLDPSEMEVSDFGGVSELRGFLSAVWNASGARTTIEAIGIIRDAETDAGAAFQSAKDAVRAIGLCPAESPLQVVGHKPRIGILILPPEKREGMLEDVCLEAVRCDAAMPCVDEYIECVSEKVPGWRDGNGKKSRVQAFLASRREPGLKLGEAAQLNAWNWDHATYGPIKQFISDLANA